MLNVKNSRRTTCTFLGALAAICAVHSASADCSGEYCNDVYVDQLYVEASGGIWLQTSGTETALTCTPDSGIFLRLAYGADGLKNIYAGLLSAQIAGWKIRVRINAGSAPCSISYVLIDRQ